MWIALLIIAVDAPLVIWCLRTDRRNRREAERAWKKDPPLQD